MNYIKIIILCCASIAFWACEDTDVYTETVPLVTFGQDTVYVYENAGSVKIPVQLSVPAVNDLTLKIAVKSENNTKENAGYAITSKTITVAKGSKEGTIDFTVEDDQVVNQPRWVELQILPESSYTLNKDENACKVIILDDESDALISFAATAQTGWENSGTLQIPVTIEGTLHKDVKLKLELKSGAPETGQEYFSLPAEVTIPAGSKSYEIAIPVTNDELPNDDRTFVMKIAGADQGIINTAKSTCTVTVRNEDSEISFEKSIYYGSKEKSAFIHIPVKAKGYVKEDFKIKLEIIPGDAAENSEYKLQSPEITLSKENMEGEIIIELLKDKIDNHSFGLKLAEASAENVYFRNNTASVRILDPFRQLLGTWKIESDSPMNMNGNCLVTLSAAPEDLYTRITCTTEAGALSSFYNVGFRWYINYDPSTTGLQWEMGKKINTAPFQFDGKDTEVRWNYYGDFGTQFVEATSDESLNTISLNDGGNYLCLMYIITSDGSNPGQDAWFQGNVRMVKQ